MELPELKREMTPEDIEALPEDLRAGWELKGDRYVANSELQAVFDEQDAQVAALEAEHANEAKSFASMKAQLSDVVAANAIRESLISAGVKSGLMRAAEAMFRSGHAIQVERRGPGDFETTVESPDGLLGLEDAVARWIDTEEGRSFLSPPRDNPMLH